MMTYFCLCETSEIFKLFFFFFFSGLDPTGPMIPVSLRLRAGMAKNVQVIHSNAGTFGDSSSSGTINFCINGGKIQPHCYNSSKSNSLLEKLVNFKKYNIIQLTLL